MVVSCKTKTQGAEEQPQARLVSSAASHSSSGTCSSFDVVPEAKRCLRDRDCSPAQSRQIQAYQREFLQQRALPKQQHRHGDPCFGPALYSMEPRVFCVESSVHAGRRRYVCAHAGRFFDHYWRSSAGERHAYELIPPHTPCRLYLDLECTARDGVLLRHNPERREELLTELWQELAEELREQFGDGWRLSNGEEEDGASSSNTYSYQLLPLQRHHVVDLDSSTDTKFSRHWIVHLPAVAVLDDTQQQYPCEALFASSQAVGHFCRRWVGRLADEQATGRLRARGRTALDAHLFTPKEGNNNNPTVECLVDLGVYTKNRLFRLMGSSKFGKPVTAALRIAEANEFPLVADGFGNECFYPPAMPQPISSSQEDDEEDDVEVKVRKSVAKTDWTRHAEALAQTLVVPLNGAKMACAILPSPEVDDNDPANIRPTL